MQPVVTPVNQPVQEGVHDFVVRMVRPAARTILKNTPNYKKILNLRLIVLSNR